MPTPPCILLVEDDDQVRGFVQALLAGEGYRILEAQTGAEGLRVGEAVDGEVDLLISDMLLPELSGFDLAVALRERFPAMRVILMTGYVEGEIVQRCLSELNAMFLDKPFQPATLRKLVREALSSQPSPTART
jgi:two-component system, cell cycle sensor histidine kinase and response regulator CckA